MKTLGIFLFDNVEVLDFAGPFEVFAVGSQLEDYTKYSVITFSKDGNKIKAVNGLAVIPDCALEKLPHLDYLVIPGGEGSKAVIQDVNVMDKLNSLINQSSWSMTVCSGSRIPAKLGLLDNNPFCTHHSVYENISSISPSAIPCPGKRFVQTSNQLYTAAGISAGIDLALFLMMKTFGKSLSEQTAAYMEYPINFTES